MRKKRVRNADMLELVDKTDQGSVALQRESSSNKIMELQCNQKYNDNGGQKFPDQFDIMDDIELLNLSKQFDMEKFLEKYRNM